MAHVTHRGGCHCGAVKFEVDADAFLASLECNCSRCQMLGFRHLIVPESRFRLLEGRESLTTYTFNTKVAQHLFCATCGVQSFYVPRSHPDGISVNTRCLDHATVTGETTTPFDGRHWEDNAASLDPLDSD